MASPQHLEIEAAKFLQKLIQESKDEPAKLATKLFVICQHMKMSGKEQSLPYQVISRAMETVINQHGLDMDALKSSRLPFSGGAPTVVPGDVRMKDKDVPESSMLPESTNDSSIKTGNVACGGQSKEISHGLPPNIRVMQDNQTIFAGQREPGNTSIIGMEETISGSSQEKQDPSGTEKSDIPKGSKDSRKVNMKRKRLDPALTMKEGPQNQISQQNDAANNISLTSKKGKLMPHGQVEDRRTEQVPMTPMQHADHQLSSFSGSKESLFRVTTEPFQGSLPEKSVTIENSFIPHSVGMKQLEEREASSVSGFPASTRGSSVQLRLDGSGSRGLWNQTKGGFPSGIAQGSPIATDSASGRMVENRALGFSQQPSGLIVNKSSAFRGPKGKESILGNAGAFDSMDQNTLRTKTETSASDTCSESNMHINVGRATGAVSKETSKSPFVAQGTPLVDLPFKEQHLRQLRAQCLVFLAFRNGLVPRKLHLEIALGERSTADDGSFKLLNQQTRELPGMGPNQIHEGKESSGMDSSHSHEAGGAPSNSIRETEKEANAIRNIPGSSPSGSLSEMDVASKEIESVRIRRENSKKGPPDCMVTSDERKRPPSATKKYDYEAECQETAESDVKASVSFAVDWVRPPESTSSQNLTEKRLHQDGNQQLEKYDHIQHSVLVRPKHAEHPLIGSAGSVIPNDTQRSTLSFTSMQKFHPNIAHASLTQSEAQTATSASGKWEPSSMTLKPPAPIKYFDHERNKQAVESARHNGVLCENELTGNTPVPGPVSSNQTQKHGQPVVPKETFTHEEEAQDGEEEEEEEEEVEDIDMEIDGRPFSPPKHTMLEKWIMDMHKKKVLDEQKWALKQRKAEESMEARIIELKEVVSSSNTTSSKTRSVIELKKLQLLHLQRRMKSEFLHDHFKPIASDMDRLKTIKKHRHGRRAKQLERYEMKMREERQKRLRERQKEFFSDLEAHKERLDDFYKARRERWKGFNRFVKEFHKRKDRIHKEKIDRIQREKINLLKNNDVEGYLRMVQDAKSERVEQLLKETEKYLRKLGAKLQEAKSVARQFEMETDDSRPINASAKGGVPVQNEDEHDQAKHYLEHNEKYYQIAHSVKESINEQPSTLQGGKLREYQMNGLRWLVSLYNNHLNGILADEMGLGKTIQVISLICYLMESKYDRGPFLVVVPSSVLPGWVSEITFWAPSITTIVYAGPPEDRRKLFKERIVHQKFNVLLTTYEYLMNKHDRPKLSKILWHYIIIDEGHRIKNAACKLNAELKHYQSSHRLLLTGTPLQNNLEELWALLNFLLPNIFNSAEDFSQWFNKPFENGNDNSPDEALLSEEENLLIINRLHQVLRPFMLRRLKHKVENELPEKIERLIRCEASAYQKLLMKRVEENLGSLGTVKGRSVHNTVMELRNICNHPYLSQLHAEEIDGFLPKHFLPPLVRHCGKLEMLDRLLPKLKATGHRVLCFSTMTRLLDVMEEYLSWKGYKYLRLDGHTSGNERGVLIDEFNKPDSAAFIFLLSIRAGGVGVNLQAADTVVIFDTDWNPQVDLQAQARAHRIGQKRDVLVLRLETVGTVEEQVRAAAEHKLGVANQSITAGFFDNNTSAEDRREYLEGLLRECKKEEAASVLDDDALNYILARSESEIDVFESIDKKRHEDELALWRKLLQAQGKDLTEQMPSRLVTEDDLKPFYQAMKIYESSNVTVSQKGEYLNICDTQQYGRGKRAREVRSYEDQWTEEEFEKLCQVDSPESPLPKEPAHDSLKTNDLGGSSKSPKEPAFDSLKSKDLGASSKPPKEPACDALKNKDLGGSSKAQGTEDQQPSKRGRGRPRRGSDASLVLGKPLESICKTETGAQQQHPGAATSADPLPSVPIKVPARRTSGSETRQRPLKHSGISAASGPSLEINQVPGPAGIVMDKSPRTFVSQEKQWLNKPSKTVVSSIGHADSPGAEPRKPADLVSVRVPGIAHIEDKNISILPGPINREPMKELVSECKRSVGEISSKSQVCENYARLVDINKQDYGGNTLKAIGTKSRKESLGQLSGTVASAESSISGKSYLQSNSFGVVGNTKPGSNKKTSLTNPIHAPGFIIGASSNPGSVPSCKIKFANEGPVSVALVEEAKMQGIINVGKMTSSCSPDSKKKMSRMGAQAQEHSVINSSFPEQTGGDNSASKAKISAECADRQLRDAHSKRKSSAEPKMHNLSGRKHSKSVTKYPVSQPIPSTTETLRIQPKIGCEQPSSSEQISASMSKSSSATIPAKTDIVQSQLNEDSKSVPSATVESATDNKGHAEASRNQPNLGSAYASSLGVTSSSMKSSITIEHSGIGTVKSQPQAGELVGGVKYANTEIGSAVIGVRRSQLKEGSACGSSIEVKSSETKKRVRKVHNKSEARKIRSKGISESSQSVKVESVATVMDQSGVQRSQLKEGSELALVERPPTTKMGHTAAVHDKTSIPVNQPKAELVTSVERKSAFREKVPASIVHDQTEAPRGQPTKGSEYAPLAEGSFAPSSVKGSRNSRDGATLESSRCVNESSRCVNSELLNDNNEAVEDVLDAKSDRVGKCLDPPVPRDGARALPCVPTPLVYSMDTNHDENVKSESVHIWTPAGVCESKMTSQTISQGSHEDKNDRTLAEDANSVEDAELMKDGTNCVVHGSEDNVEILVSKVGESLPDKPDIFPCEDHLSEISGGGKVFIINAETEERPSPTNLSHDEAPPGFDAVVSKADNIVAAKYVDFNLEVQHLEGVSHEKCGEEVSTVSGSSSDMPCLEGDRQHSEHNLVIGIGMASGPEVSASDEGISEAHVLTQSNDAVVHSNTSSVKESIDSEDGAKHETSCCVESEVLNANYEAVEDVLDQKSDKVGNCLRPPVSQDDTHALPGVPTLLVHTVDTDHDQDVVLESFQIDGEVHATETRAVLPSQLCSLEVELSQPLTSEETSLCEDGSPAHCHASGKNTAVPVIDGNVIIPKTTGNCNKTEEQEKLCSATVDADDECVDANVAGHPDVECDTKGEKSDAMQCADSGVSSAAEEVAGDGNVTEGREKLPRAKATVDNEYVDKDLAVHVDINGDGSNVDPCPDTSASSTAEERAGDCHATEGEEKLGAATVNVDNKSVDTTMTVHVGINGKRSDAEPCPDMKASSTAEETAEDCHATEGEEKLGAATANVSNECVDTTMTVHVGINGKRSDAEPCPDSKASSTAEELVGDCHAIEGEEKLGVAMGNVNNKYVDTTMTVNVDGESKIDGKKSDVTPCPDTVPSSAAEGMAGNSCKTEEQEKLTVVAVTLDNDVALHADASVVAHLVGEHDNDCSTLLPPSHMQPVSKKCSVAEVATNVAGHSDGERDSKSEKRDAVPYAGLGVTSVAGNATEGQEKLPRATVTVDNEHDDMDVAIHVDINGERRDVEPCPDMNTSSTAEGRAGDCYATEEEKLGAATVNVNEECVDTTMTVHLDGECDINGTKSNVMSCPDTAPSSAAEGMAENHSKRRDVEPCPDMNTSSTAEERAGDCHATEGEEKLGAAMVNVVEECVDTTVTVHLDGECDINGTKSNVTSCPDTAPSSAAEGMAENHSKRRDAKPCPDMNTFSTAEERAGDCYATEGEEKLGAATVNIEEECVDTTMTVHLDGECDINDTKSDVTPCTDTTPSSAAEGMAANHSKRRDVEPCPDIKAFSTTEETAGDCHATEEEKVGAATVNVDKECVDTAMTVHLDGEGDINGSKIDVTPCPDTARSSAAGGMAGNNSKTEEQEKLPEAAAVAGGSTEIATRSNESENIATETDSTQVMHLPESANQNATSFSESVHPLLPQNES